MSKRGRELFWMKPEITPGEASGKTQVHFIQEKRLAKIRYKHAKAFKENLNFPMTRWKWESWRKVRDVFYLSTQYAELNKEVNFRYHQKSEFLESARVSLNLELVKPEFPGQCSCSYIYCLKLTASYGLWARCLQQEEVLSTDLNVLYK